MNTNKKIAVITGASRGIGKNVAVSLAASEYHVVLLARTEQALMEVKSEITDNNGSASYFAVDVSRSSQIKECIDCIIREYGHIDVLFNNAGILKHGTSDILDKDLDELLQINLHGAIYVAKHTAQYMKKQRNGYIINLSSIGGKIAASFAGGYSASKFGLNGFSEALFKEMSAYDVKVSTICPAMVATDMVLNDRDFDADLMIQPNDIVKTINYLLSLSKNAIPSELVINCLSFTARETEARKSVYNLKTN